MENKMNKLQELILMIAKEVKRICEKYDIKYYLDGGTLLGAVRHKGFIPWDDDLDILIKRKDFDKFIEVCDKELDKEKFFLQTESTEEKYAFSFAKVQLLGTEIIEDFSKDVPIHHGIFVDIFPYDNLPDGHLTRKIFLLKNHILKNIIWVKCGYGKEKIKKNKRFLIFKLLGLPFSLEKLKNTRHRLITKYNNIDTEMSFNSDYPKHRKYNAEFEKIKIYDFENTQFTGVENADVVLTRQYGDYMTLPPENQRVTHSKYEINYGKYN